MNLSDQPTPEPNLLDPAVTADADVDGPEVGVLPTMADLDQLATALDRVDHTLAALDAPGT